MWDNLLLFIDNSISAHAHEVILHFPVDPSECYVAICDNGNGMTKAELFDAMKYGSEAKRNGRSDDDLGRFGLGLKAASLSQCRKLTVISKKDGKVSAYIWDLDVIEEKRDWYVVEWKIIKMDVHDKETRSYNMSCIKGKNTKPEEIVRKYLFSQGFRYRKNDKGLPGTPDNVLPKYKTVIFVNGCFWHGHEGCRYFVIPKTNTEFWVNKIETNKQRDHKKINDLHALGWKVIIVWECELKKNRFLDTMKSLSNLIINDNEV